MEWVKVAVVKSSSHPGKIYTISKRGEQYGCSCPAYKFAKTAHGCKHIEAFVKSDSTMQQFPVTVTVSAKEALTIRRSISFDDDLAASPSHVEEVVVKTPRSEQTVTIPRKAAKELLKHVCDAWKFTIINGPEEHRLARLENVLRDCLNKEQNQ